MPFQNAPLARGVSIDAVMASVAMCAALTADSSAPAGARACVGARVRVRARPARRGGHAPPPAQQAALAVGSPRAPRPRVARARTC